MRIVFIGASHRTILTTRMLLEEGHDVVIVEKDGDKIERLSDNLDCGFIHDDGGKPQVLKDLSAENTDILFCIADSDRDNIIASLIARNIGYERIITSLENPEYEAVAEDLEFAETIVPDREVARALFDMASGRTRFELSSQFKPNVRFLSYTVARDGPATAADLDLPEAARVVAVNRGDETLLTDPSMALEPDDVVIVLCAEDAAGELEERWSRVG